MIPSPLWGEGQGWGGAHWPSRSLPGGAASRARHFDFGALTLTQPSVAFVYECEDPLEGEGS
jgi:hypothetical protein